MSEPMSGRVAEFGIAAHPLYKDDISPVSNQWQDAKGRRRSVPIAAPAKPSSARRWQYPREFLEHTSWSFFRIGLSFFTRRDD